MNEKYPKYQLLEVSEQYLTYRKYIDEYHYEDVDIEINCIPQLKQENQQLKEKIEMLKQADRNTYESAQDMLSELDTENKKLKEQNRREFNDFIKFKKEQADRHLEEKDKLIKENYHLRKQLQQREAIIEEAIEYVKNRILEDDYMLKTDTKMVQEELIYILIKCKGDKNE